MSNAQIYNLASIMALIGAILCADKPTPFQTIGCLIVMLVCSAISVSYRTKEKKE